MNGTRAVERADSLVRRLPPRPDSVATARDLVRVLLTRAGADEIVEASQLLVSEVVTNALLHAGTDIELSAAVDEHELRVEVGDGSSHLPTKRDYAVTSGTGRGLKLLEQMADDWGVTRTRRGKCVWFRLELRHLEHAADQPPSTSPDDVPAATISGRTAEVVLRNVPLLLHAAWQQHAEALLREYLLVSMDATDEDADDDLSLDAIQTHADATDAIAILEEHVPRAPVVAVPDRVMEDATDPALSATEVVMPVPVRSVAHFATLDRAIETALELAEDGRVMTPPTQPEIRQFRRWVCREVQRQAAGRPATPWAVDAGPGTPVREEPEWDDSVSASAHAQVAADDANRILAVSPSALRLLGYDSDELVGRRIVTLIPERYRQAHVAGFTMYLLVGRRPLLDAPVVVPFRCADGGEVMIRMRVSAEPTPDGRQVFLADLDPVADPA